MAVNKPSEFVKPNKFDPLDPIYQGQPGEVTNKALFELLQALSGAIQTIEGAQEPLNLTITNNSIAVDRYRNNVITTGTLSTVSVVNINGGPTINIGGIVELVLKTGTTVTNSSNVDGIQTLVGANFTTESEYIMKLVRIDGRWREIEGAGSLINDLRTYVESVEATANSARTTAINALPKSGGTATYLNITNNLDVGGNLLLGADNVNVLGKLNENTSAINTVQSIANGALQRTGGYVSGKIGIEANITGTNYANQAVVLSAINAVTADNLAKSLAIGFFKSGVFGSSFGVKSGEGHFSAFDNEGNYIPIYMSDVYLGSNASSVTSLMGWLQAIEAEISDIPTADNVVVKSAGAGDQIINNRVVVNKNVDIQYSDTIVDPGGNTANGVTSDWQGQRMSFRARHNAGRYYGARITVSEQDAVNKKFYDFSPYGNIDFSDINGVVGSIDFAPKAPRPTSSAGLGQWAQPELISVGGSDTGTCVYTKAQSSEEFTANNVTQIECDNLAAQENGLVISWINTNPTSYKVVVPAGGTWAYFVIIDGKAYTGVTSNSTPIKQDVTTLPIVQGFCYRII